MCVSKQFSLHRAFSGIIHNHTFSHQCCLATISRHLENLTLGKPRHHTNLSSLLFPLQRCALQGGGIEWLVEYITNDPQYRILFGELLKHAILLPPLLLMSILLNFVSSHLDLPKDFFEKAEHVLIKCISLLMISFAFYTVVVTLLDAGFRITKRLWQRINMD